MNVEDASMTRSIILLWAIRYPTKLEWTIIRKLLRTYGRSRGVDVKKLLRQIKTCDEIAIYQLIVELGIDNDEIAVVSETAFKNDMGDPRKRTEEANQIHENAEDW